MSGVSDFKKRKQIEQARMTGQLAPETDTETGKMINPHNPDFISKRPWYLGASGPSLKHHSKQKIDHVLSMSEADAIFQNSWVGKNSKSSEINQFRKGACKNCGAMGHKTNECLERPRPIKKSAWKTGMTIASDDRKLDLEAYGKLNFDGKRDRWHGYHPDQHKEVVERFNKLDEERRIARQQAHEEARKLKADKEKDSKKSFKSKKNEVNENEPIGSAASDSDSDSDVGSDSEGENEEFIEKDSDKRDFQGRVARQGGLGGAQMATTVRNLRIREDRAKYLYNLDPNSAYYDPKTRAMRENPNPTENPEELAYAGDNFVRYGGNVKEFAKTQIYAWEASARGQEIHPLADPSQAELLHKQYQEKKATLKADQKQKILSKYGGEEHLKEKSARLLLGQSEAYVEYDRAGRIIKGATKAVAKSKYEEDVFYGNHTSVWGSYFDKSSQKWGYACCHVLNKSYFCTVEACKSDKEKLQLETKE